MDIHSLQTPALLLDTQKMERNIERLKHRLKSQNVAFRPHLKTAKCVEIARLLMSSAEGPAAVSTLQEAEFFHKAGVRDILYAVGIAPQKLERVVNLRRQGTDICILL